MEDIYIKITDSCNEFQRLLDETLFYSLNISKVFFASLWILLPFFTIPFFLMYTLPDSIIHGLNAIWLILLFFIFLQNGIIERLISHITVKLLVKRQYDLISLIYSYDFDENKILEIPKILSITENIKSLLLPSKTGILFLRFLLFLEKKGIRQSMSIGLSTWDKLPKYQVEELNNRMRDKKNKLLYLINESRFNEINLIQYILSDLRSDLSIRLTEQQHSLESAKSEVEKIEQTPLPPLSGGLDKGLNQVSELQKARLDRQIEQFEELQRVLIKV